MATWEMEWKSSSGWLLTSVFSVFSIFYIQVPFILCSYSNCLYLNLFPIFTYYLTLFFCLLSWQCFEVCCSHRQKSRCREAWSTTSVFSRPWRDGLSVLLSPPSSKMLPLWSSNKTQWPNSHLNLQNKHRLISHTLLWTSGIHNVLTRLKKKTKKTPFLTRYLSINLRDSIERD